ncbi:MAG: NFACT RNA binding domain-containing protein [Gemmatimonadota bacterium]|jgi:predicted ribosome quality control (RQC) complex YloA/Tae2 family protein
MSMIWDAPLTAAVARDLDSRLSGGRLRAHIFDWERRELSLFFRTLTVRWSLHPDAGWVRLSSAAEPSGAARPLAADLLKVEALPDERLLRFKLRKLRGRVRSVQIVVELMTNQWNALLVEDSEEWIRHVLWRRRSENRDLSPGQSYRAPDPSSRLGVGSSLTEADWNRLLAEVEPGEAGRTLLETMAFTSPVNVSALLDAPNGYALWERLRTLESLDPCLLEFDRGKQPYPIVINDFTFDRFETILDAVEAAAEAGDEAHHPEASVLQELDRAIEQARGKVRGIQRELEEAADPEVTREKASLILARLGEIPKGVSEISIAGFQGDPVQLTLDPALSAHENAEALYREASRQERARDRLPALLEGARARVARLESLLEGVRSGTIDPGEASLSLPSRAPGGKGRPVRKDGRLPFKRFRSSGGLEILVGRGPADNDELTFRHARPDDIWLHAREAGGAHVVLRWSRKEPPPGKDLSEAAALAALNSRARSAGVVPVDWARRKHVRKPRKAPPGTVRLEQASTLFVEPDPELPGRLLWEE